MMTDERVWIRPTPAIKDEKAEIGYNGLLAKSGADSVWIHYGHDGWKNTQFQQMTKRGDGSFATNISCRADRQMNFCFKDSANHWDNNSGWNWSCDVRPNVKM